MFLINIIIFLCKWITEMIHNSVIISYYINWRLDKNWLFFVCFYCYVDIMVFKIPRQYRIHTFRKLNKKYSVYFFVLFNFNFKYNCLVYVILNRNGLFLISLFIISRVENGVSIWIWFFLNCLFYNIIYRKIKIHSYMIRLDIKLNHVFKNFI